MDIGKCSMDSNPAIANEMESIPIDVAQLIVMGRRNLSDVV